VSLFFYHLFIWFYQAAVLIVSPWNAKAKAWLAGRKNIMQRIRSAGIDSTQGLIWMHCASLGEFEQGRPVLEKLKILFPQYKALVTFFSPTAFNIHRQYPGAEYIFYLPMDSAKHARQFLDAANPTLVLWIKHDFWYHYLHELNKRKIAVLLLSAVFRGDQPFFRWHGSLHRRMLNCFTHLFVQTQQSKKWLQTLALSPAVSVSGDTRFDRVIDTAEHFEPIPIVEQFCGRAQVIVAGSTWYEDIHELDHYANSHPLIRFVVAPHDIDEESLKETESLFHKSIRLSVLERALAATANRLPGAGGAGLLTEINVLIIDNIGMLSRLYKYGTIAYVGGGFVDRGVHNVPEAAVYGKPVVCGPVIEQEEEVQELVECGGTIIIDSALEAEAAFTRLFTLDKEYRFASEASRRYVYAKKGATDKIIRFIQENLLLTT
jgi:3-deoxy-D-manno-octulosonic-acid transferase